MADQKPMTDEEYAEMQARVEAERSRRAVEAAQARADKIKPITDMVQSDAWASIREQIPDAVAAAVGETYWPQVDALRQIVGLLDAQLPQPAVAAG